PAFEVLSLLAERPLSLLRSSGLDWVEIEELLSRRAAVTFGELDGIDHRLSRFIELGELAGHTMPGPWRSEAAKRLRLSAEDLEKRLERLDGWRGLKWDPQLGTMVFVG
ncbi:MAG: hypothetical protein K8R59_08510, partial [Thermoanaerobaculales bacterium]|nr:hypothetical protein [Thermoanaerobaculales bacterium]